MTDQYTDQTDQVHSAAKSDEEHVQDLKQAITGLGTAILDLKMNNDTENGEKVESLEKRYSELRNEFEAFEAAERDYTSFASQGETTTPGDSTNFETLKKQGAEKWAQAQQRMSESYDAMKVYVTDPDNQEAVKKSARDMGAAFSAAWSEVARGFENAAKRLRESRADQNNPSASQTPQTETTPPPPPKPDTNVPPGSSQS